MVALGQRLDLMLLEVFSNLNDPVIPTLVPLSHLQRGSVPGGLTVVVFQTPFEVQQLSSSNSVCYKCKLHSSLSKLSLRECV